MTTATNISYKPAGITSVCQQCTGCKHLGSCKGLLRWSRIDCPDWYTRHLVADCIGRVQIRTSTV